MATYGSSVTARNLAKNNIVSSNGKFVKFCMEATESLEAEAKFTYVSLLKKSIEQCINLISSTLTDLLPGKI